MQEKNNLKEIVQLEGLELSGWSLNDRKTAVEMFRSRKILHPLSVLRA